MNEIKVAENKTLKLTNVVARRIAPEELGLAAGMAMALLLI